MKPSRDIIENASEAKNLTTLVRALQAADLDETLEDKGSFTLFAPTDSAFGKLTPGTLDTLLKPENKSQLVDILNYHVVSGRYKSTDLRAGMTLNTLGGKTLTIGTKDGKMTVNDVALIETADAVSSNGVMHVIDTVLTPPAGLTVGGAVMLPTANLVENASKADTLTQLVKAITAANLATTLKGDGPYTVFAPTDSAFSKLANGLLEKLMKPENKAQLANLLSYHVVSGKYQSKDLTDGMKLKTLQGKELLVHNKNGKITINDVAVVQIPDVISSNGVSFIIDTVLQMPQ